jgi:hypothetical protein
MIKLNRKCMFCKKEDLVCEANETLSPDIYDLRVIIYCDNNKCSQYGENQFDKELNINDDMDDLR